MMEPLFLQRTVSYVLHTGDVSSKDTFSYAIDSEIVEPNDRATG